MDYGLSDGDRILNPHFSSNSVSQFMACSWANKTVAGVVSCSSAGGDQRRPRWRGSYVWTRSESIHFADPDLDSLFTGHQLREHLRVVVAEVIGENDLRPHCLDGIDEHLMIHCVELGSEARVVHR
jgi:hypothetical protein